MNTNPTYKVRVADLIFAVRLPNGELPPNYAPFVVDESENAISDEPIFTLDVQMGTIPSEPQVEYTHVYTDNNEADMPRIEIYRYNDGYIFRVAPLAQAPTCCALECNADFTKAMLTVDNQTNDQRFALDNAMMLMYAFRTASLSVLEMHAAVVVYQGKGYLFLGKSGTGKSTHARQWLKAFEGSWLLNDDNPILRVMESGELRVYGSPWSGKTPCYNQAWAPVGSITKLSQAPKNERRDLRLPEAYAYMLSSASGLKIEPRMSDCLYETIKQIITTTPCYHLDCLPNEDAAQVCYGNAK